jgi:hypothetical protein
MFASHAQAISDKKHALPCVVDFLLHGFCFFRAGNGRGQPYNPILYWMGFDFRIEVIPLKGRRTS